MKKIFTLTVILLSILVMTKGAFCVPSSQELRDVTLPDGSTMRLRLIGDEFMAWFETEDGYTAIRNEDGFFEYALLDFNDMLIPSGITVGPTPPPIMQKIRPSSKVLLNARKRQAPLPSLMPRAATSIIGSEKALVLLIEYPDYPYTAGTHEVAFFDDLYFGTGFGTVNNYLQTVSENKLEISGTASGWYMSKFNRATYGVGSMVTPAFDNAKDLVLEVVKAADLAGVSFADYDKDGDGYVDHLAIVHAGYGAEVSGNPADIWSHSWNIAPYQTSDGTYVTNYIIMGENNTMGIHVHELLHDFGAPDLYDVNYIDDPIELWCVMAYGSYGGSPAGTVPTEVCGYLKSDLDADPTNGADGWVDLYTVPSGQNGTYMVTRHTEMNGNKIYRVNVLGWTEAFYIENRQLTGYDVSLPDDGIAIYHVDESMGSDYRVNDGTNNFYRILIEDAGNNIDPFFLDRETYDAAYSLDDAQTVFSATSTPNTNSNNGYATGLTINNISSSGKFMSFDLTLGGIIPNSFPLANVVASPISGAPPLTVSFTGSATDSDGTIASYHYDFGDGSTSTEQDPTHTYTTAGDYNVTFTATDDDGAISMAMVTVSASGALASNLSPSPTITATPASGKVPLTVFFTGNATDSDGSIISYSYDFGNGEGSTLQDPVYRYLNPGTYTATLYVTDDDGAVSTDSVTITVTGAGSSSDDDFLGIDLGLGCGMSTSGNLRPPSNGQRLLDMLVFMLPMFLLLGRRIYARIYTS